MLPFGLKSESGPLNTVRDNVADPGYLGAVLDYLLANERFLIEFTERVGDAPELLYAARRKPERAIPP